MCLSTRFVSNSDKEWSFVNELKQMKGEGDVVFWPIPSN